MTPEAFVEKWRQVSVKESAAAHSHFEDLCDLLGVEKPLDVDPAGDWYAYEKHVSKAAGGKGFADVWKKGYFAWEYKGKRKNLDAAYLQLLLYRDDLANPPLLIVSDLEWIEIHTNFTGTNKRLYALTLDDLLDSEKRELLRKAFTDPEALNPQHQRQRITEDATARIGEIALKLRDREHDPQGVAHFLMQLVFALFAEDVELLPNQLVSEILEKTKGNPERAKQYLTMLFNAMASGGEVLLHDVPYFNGGLFQNGESLELTSEELGILYEAARLDWSEVEPAIFGTLFERSLDPQKRSQLGAHYTSRDDILRIVQPVVIEPLRREWHDIREEVEKRLKRGHHKKATELVGAFLQKLHNVRVLDPACGSGNFLYVAMQQLKELEKEVSILAQQVNAPSMAFVGPKQFYGLEKSVFAVELTSMVVWIGYLQWSLANGPGNVQTPILEKLETIRLHDALMNYDGTEYAWPEADFIIGNPPFLGDKRMRARLGDGYVEQLRNLFADRLPSQSDLVCYWFEKARRMVAKGCTGRVGLLATNSIRGGANRVVLERIKQTGDIFMAWSDEQWVLEGAAIRVSLVGFDAGSETRRMLNDRPVGEIQPDLTAGPNLGTAKPLTENLGFGFNGVMPSGPFDIPDEVAHSWLDLPNPSGVDNREVLKPYLSGRDLVGAPMHRWIVDFGLMAQEEAERYAVPFEYVLQNVKPVRDSNRRASTRERWWRFGEARPALRKALEPLTRYIATPEVSKHRIFVWLSKDVLPAHKVVVIASDDEATFGVLNSRIHTIWAEAMGSWHGVGNDLRYTYSTIFETFPFPPSTRDGVTAVNSWAANIDEVRQGILECADELTLTGLYNEIEELREHRDAGRRAYPLLVAHEKLDEAVAGAYGWEWPLEDEEILERLLRLNVERAGEEAERQGGAITTGRGRVSRFQDDS